MKGRMLPLFVIFSAVLLPQFMINLFGTQNYLAAALLGGVLAVYLAIFVSYFIKYLQFKNNTLK